MIKPYGADSLVNGLISKEKVKELAKNKIRRLICDEHVILECSRIADGSLTPIEGFLYKDEIDSIIETSKLKNGIYFPIPIFLQVPSEWLGIKNETVALANQDNEIIGYIEKASTFKYDLKMLCGYIYGTDDIKHPGVKRILDRGEVFIGGKIHIIEIKNSLSNYCLSPREVREEIRKRGWKTCTGFQTRNVPHKAHEHLQRVALDITDGVLLHPVIGWKKKNDYLPEVVIGAYEHLANNIYPSRRVIVSGLQIAMRYAGPKEAAFHSIVRQNHGCTHFIVGRDHAGVGGYYGKYEAHEYIEKVQQYLDISVLKLCGPFYCEKCGQIVTEKTCGHDKKYHKEISGTIIRDSIINGKIPQDFMIRKEIVEVIRSFDNIFIK